MNKQRITGVIASAFITVIIITYAAFMLVGINDDVLITAQDRNYFTNDALFFTERIAHPFGFFQYIGSYLTQYFYYPAAGAALLILMWAVSVMAGIKAFRLQGMWKALMIVPVACLLASVVDLGYWIYFLPIPGYWFSQTTAFMCMLLLLWAANATPRRMRIVWYVVIGFAGFPVYGWFSYLFAVCLALSQWRKGECTPTWIDGSGMTLAAVAPLVFNALLYDKLPVDNVFTAGFPVFSNATDTSLRPSIPFYIMTATTALTALGGVLPKVKRVPAAIAYAVVGVISGAAVWSTMFKDDNYHYEMQMTQATERNDWQTVVSVAEKTKTPSRTMVMLKNIALMNMGQLGTRSFELGNDGIEINNPDHLNLSIMHIASPLIYYNYGEVNYAMRWCMEFAVVYGFSPYYAKTLAQCAKASGETMLMNRYTDLMHRTTFYKDWMPSKPSAIVSEQQKTPDALANDENNCELYLITSLSKKRSKKSLLINEVALFYSLISRSNDNFWPSFYYYLENFKGEDLPISYLEAYCLFADKRPVQFPYKFKIHEKITNNYKYFWQMGNQYAQQGMDEAGVREAMRDYWSGTYWWFNAFGRDAY